jgi:S1-C subfamily serine protease
MDPEDGLDDDGPVFGWLPPDDRLWRHPSEVEPSALLVRRTRQLESRIVGIALLAGLTGALLTIGFGVIAGWFPHSTTVIRPVERVNDVTTPLGRTVSTAGTEPNADIVAIAELVRPAIVQLEVDGDRGPANGSGVIFRSDGEIITNQHVVDGAHSIIAVLDDGSRVKAKLVGTDLETDIAVVKINGQRPVVTLGTTAGLKVGQLAVAVGSPLGLAGGASVTTGVVSALARTVTTSDGPPLLDMIQTDAPIAPGSSGGALVDHSGDVIGITSAEAVTAGAAGLGFAIPIDVARDVAEQLIASGHVTHVWLGVEGEDVDSVQATQMGINGGAVIKKVVTGSPAAKAGFAGSDVITGIDNIPIMGMGALVVTLRSRHVGEKVMISYLHGDQPRSVVVTLTERPANPPA